MSKKILVSRKTQQSTKLAGLGEVLEPAKDRSLTDSAFSTMSSADSSSKLAAEADVAVVNGTALLEGDAEEQSVLLAAREAGLPIVVENANQDIMLAETGVGISADVAVIQRLNDGLHFTVPAQGEIGELDATEAIEDVTDGDLSDQDLNKDTTVLEAEKAKAVEIVSPPLVEQVQEILDAQAEVVVASTDELQDAGSKSIFFLNWAPQTWQLSWDDGGLQEPLIHVEFKIELYAVNNPFNKFLRISSSGAGIRPGEMRYNKETARGYYLESAVVEYGPQALPRDVSIFHTSPDNNNSLGSHSVSTGFEIGASIDKDGPGLSASYQGSETKTVELRDFTVENKVNAVRGRWEYHLASVEGQKYEDWTDLYAGSGTHRFLTPPDYARNGFLPGTLVEWKAPGDFNGKVKINFYVEQIVRLVWLERYKNVFGMTMKSKWYKDFKWIHQRNEITIDFSEVQAPVLPPSREELAQQFGKLAEQIEAIEGRFTSVEGQIRQLTLNQQSLLKTSHIHSREIRPVPASLPSAGNDRGLIVLLYRSDRRGLWAVVQWQDKRGNWHDTNWKGSLGVADGVASRSEAITNEHQLGTGPFRWQLFDKEGGELLTATDAFYLPAAKGETVFIEVYGLPRG